MSPASVSIPDDLAACQELLRQQAEVTAQQSETIDQQHQQIEKLRHELELFKRYIFGQRRERFIDPAQGKLFELEPDEPAVEAPAEAEGAGAPPKKRPGHGRRRLPASLPRQRIVHKLDEAQRRCRIERLFQLPDEDVYVHVVYTNMVKCTTLSNSDPHNRQVVGNAIHNPLEHFLFLAHRRPVKSDYRA